MERLFHPRTPSHYESHAHLEGTRSWPSVVCAHPPTGSVGASEARAVEIHGNEVTVYEAAFTPMRYALSETGLPTAMKPVCAGPEQRVVGIHIIGEGADEMLQGFAVALKMGATKADLDRTVAIHPSSAEALVTLKQGGPARGTVQRVAA